MAQNKTASLIIVGIIFLALGLFIGTKIVSPQLGPTSPTTSFTAIEQEGQVVLMGTPGIFPDKDPILKTNFYLNWTGATSRIRYIQTNFVNITHRMPALSEACFEVTYLDVNKRIINTTGLGVTNNLCIMVDDWNFFTPIKALKIVNGTGIANQTGFALITVPQIN